MTNTKQLATLLGLGALLFRRGKSLKAAKAECISKGLVAADDIVGLGHINEGWQTERNVSILEAA